MSNYISILITISIVGGVISSLVSDKSSLKRYINMIISIICVIALLSPLNNFVNKIDNIKSNIENLFDSSLKSEAINNTNEIIIDSGVSHIQDGIKSVIIERFSIKKEDIQVNVEVDDTSINNVKITAITVILSN